MSSPQISAAESASSTYPASLSLVGQQSAIKLCSIASASGQSAVMGLGNWRFALGDCSLPILLLRHTGPDGLIVDYRACQHCRQKVDSSLTWSTPSAAYPIASARFAKSSGPCGSGVTSAGAMPGCI
jgi:hypothetical protein